MHLSELLKLNMVVNVDEDMTKDAKEAGNINNGHLLHTHKD